MNALAMNMQKLLELLFVILRFRCSFCPATLDLRSEGNNAL